MVKNTTTKPKSTKTTQRSDGHKKPAPKRSTTKTRVKSNTKTVDYYPNRVPFYTAVSAVMILLLLAVIVSL